MVAVTFAVPLPPPVTRPVLLTVDDRLVGVDQDTSPEVPSGRSLAVSWAFHPRKLGDVGAVQFHAGGQRDFRDRSVAPEGWESIGSVVSGGSVGSVFRTYRSVPSWQGFGRSFRTAV
jgi:hypothetical protein